MRTRRRRCSRRLGSRGATTSALLAEAGHDVLMVEEVLDLRVDSAPNYSAQEMSQKYRNHGLNTTFGKTGVTYIEGRCVGGASEINAALRVPRRDARRLAPGLPHRRLRDAVLGTSSRSRRNSRSRSAPTASRRTPAGRRRRETWVEAHRDRALLALRQDDGRAAVASRCPRPWCPDPVRKRVADTKAAHPAQGQLAVAAEAVTRLEGGRREKIPLFDELVVCGGAVQTPVLLRRSGAATWARPPPPPHGPHRPLRARNDPAFGVPVRQVSGWAGDPPGCSHSPCPTSPWLGDGVRQGRRHADWAWRVLRRHGRARAAEASGRCRSSASPSSATT